MSNKDSLLTVALLSTLWEKEQRDYLDVLGQFVLRCLPCDVDTRVDVGAITSKLRSNYGFADIPQHVVEKVLRRLCKRLRSTEPYLRQRDRGFYVFRQFDHLSFDSAQKETNAQITDVLAAFVTYLESNYLRKKISVDEASEFLFHFFDSYGLTVVHDSDSLRAITKENGGYNFYAARFVLESYEKRTSIFDKLINITTGFLIHKAVYFYSQEIKSSFDSKLKNVVFYLDCSLVIDTLGYDDINDENAIEELCQLVRSNGGKIHVFQHTVEEASRVLSAYANKPLYRNAFTLTGLAARKYPSEILSTITTVQSIEENLSKKGIITCASPSYDATRIIAGKREYQGFEDEMAIEQQLLKYLKPKNGVLNGDRLRYDTQTLSAIGRLRQNRRPNNIENSIAMVITQGSILNNCMRELYPKRFPAEIDYAINDLDLVSLLWLGQHNKESQLPKNLLIANAVAACQVSQDMMDHAIELVGEMEKDKTIPREAALIIRSKTAIRNILFEETHNDLDCLNESTINKVIKRFVSQESRADSESAVAKAVGDNEEKLKAKHAEEIYQIRNELERAHQSSRQQAISLRDDAERVANKKADCAEQSARIIVSLVWVIFLCGSLYFWAEGGWVTTSTSAIIMSVLGGIQLLDFIFEFYDHKTRLAMWTRDKVFANVHAKEIKKREKMARISLTF